MSRNKKVEYPHPGEILLKEFIEPFGFTEFGLAIRIGEHASNIIAITSGNSPISVNTALRLSRFFKLSESYWLDLQTEYKIRKEKEKPGYSIDHIKPFGEE